MTIVGEDTNPYAQYKEAFTQEAIVAGLTGYIDNDMTDEPLNVSDDMIATFEETEVYNLMDVELDCGNDEEGYDELDDELIEEEFEARSQLSEAIKAKLILTTEETTVEVVDEVFDETEAFDFYDMDEEFYF